MSMTNKIFMIGIIIVMILLSGCENSTEEASQTNLAAVSLNEATAAAEDISAISSDFNVMLLESDAVQLSSVTIDIITSDSDAEIKEPITCEENDRDFITASIVMVQIYENYAWGFEQEITVIDSNGSCYYFEAYGEGVDSSEGISLYEDDDWYDKLVEITESKSIGQISEDISDVIQEFLCDIEQYESYPVKEYPSTLRDYGTESLYGIYIDENNIPQYVKLCQYGNNIKCIDNDEVVDFVNQMINSDIFYTEEFHY